MAFQYSEGMEKGMEKGRQEKDEAVTKARQEMAKAMLLKGIEIETVAAVTELPKEEIKKLLS
jgi:predicted transposase/invertase (TIGR01784 family)